MALLSASPDCCVASSRPTRRREGEGRGKCRKKPISKTGVWRGVGEKSGAKEGEKACRRKLAGRVVHSGGTIEPCSTARTSALAESSAPCPSRRSPARWPREDRKDARTHPTTSLRRIRILTLLHRSPHARDKIIPRRLAVPYQSVPPSLQISVSLWEGKGRRRTRQKLPRLGPVDARGLRAGAGCALSVVGA